jgi:hypothetical protein
MDKIADEMGAAAVTKAILARRLSDTLERAGIATSIIRILGSYVHIDTWAKYDAALRDVLGKMGAQVQHLPGGADGKHLDGSSAYRLVAKFEGGMP